MGGIYKSKGGLMTDEPIYSVLNGKGVTGFIVSGSSQNYYPQEDTYVNGNGKYCPRRHPTTGEIFTGDTGRYNYYLNQDPCGEYGCYGLNHYFYPEGSLYVNSPAGGYWVLFFQGYISIEIVSFVASDSITPPLTGWSDGVTLSQVSC